MPPKKQTHLIEEAFKKLKIEKNRILTAFDEICSQFELSISGASISQNSSKSSQLTKDFKTKSSMSRFREHEIPGLFLNSTTFSVVAYFVKLKTDTQHP